MRDDRIAENDQDEDEQLDSGSEIEEDDFPNEIYKRGTRNKLSTKYWII